MPTERVFRVLEPIAHIAALICGYACLGLCFLVGFEVVARKLFHFSIQGADEIGGYVLAVTAAVGFAYALLHRVHTRIEIGLVRLPQAAQAVLNVFAAVLLAGFAVFMAYEAWRALAESIEFGSRASTPLQTPLWIPQGLWMLGLAIFALLSVAMAAHAMVLLFKDRRQLNRTYGPPALSDEIDEQLSEAERQLQCDAVGEPT